MKKNAIAAALRRQHPNWVGMSNNDVLRAFCAQPDGIAPRQPEGLPRPRDRQRCGSDEFLESYQWRRLRMEVIVERGARCECCGATPADGVTVINVDHIKPRKLYPELALVKSNLQVLCHVCNHGKGNWDQTDWRQPNETDPMPVAGTARQAVTSPVKRKVVRQFAEMVDRHVAAMLRQRRGSVQLHADLRPRLVKTNGGKAG